jgi:hypothetical protein
MISLILLASIALILTFAIKIPVFYLLTKIFNKEVKFLTSLKALISFEVLYFIFACIYFSPIYSSSWRSILLSIGMILIPGGLFLLTNRVIKLTNWKKAMILFILMFLIATPIIVYFTNIVVGNITSPENITVPGWDTVINPPLNWRIMNKMENSISNKILIQHLIPIILFSIQKIL